MTKLRSINWVHVAAVILVYGFMAGAARFSYHHIESLFLWLGCSAEEAHWAPIFIDGFAFLGWLGRRRRFVEETRKTGLRLMYGAGAVSLVCNVAAGHTWGSRLFGVVVVTGFMVAERYADRLSPRPVGRKLDPAVAKRRAAKAAATRAAKACALAAAAAPVAPAPEPEPAVPARPVHAPTTTRTRRPTPAARRAPSTPRLGKVAPGWLTPTVRLAVANAA